MEPPSDSTKFLVIQTASIGDVILATSVLEKLHHNFPGAFIGFVLKKGCEGLFSGHPYLNKVYTWDKESGKYKDLKRIIKEVRQENYDYVINLHRFASSGLLTAFSGAKTRAGFSKNPISFLYNHKVKHHIGEKWPRHEIERNNDLLNKICTGPPAKVKLYPAREDFTIVASYKEKPYTTIAPISLWFTKQYPEELWLELIKNTPADRNVYLLGSEKDKPLLNNFVQRADQSHVVNLGGKLNLLQTAALIKDARMNFTNDSAPLHLASAMNAPVTAVFCSTLPEFGFGPLSDDSAVIEIKEKLTCRPCGIHGKKECPEHTMACAYGISPARLIERIKL
jgi:ADP-heptose:LPS heptosyltransferase